MVVFAVPVSLVGSRCTVAVVDARVTAITRRAFRGRVCVPVQRAVAVTGVTGAGGEDAKGVVR